MATETEEKKDATGNGRNVGRIEEIQGVVIEAVFPDELPEINSAIYIEREASEDAAKISGGISATTACARSPWTPPTAWLAAWRSSTPAARSRSRSATSPSVASSTCSA